jgi:hypothetical protein
MKIRTMVFVVATMTMVGAIGYHLGSSNREFSLNQQLISNPLTKAERAPSVKEGFVKDMNQEQTFESSRSLVDSKQIEDGFENQERKTGEFNANEAHEPDYSTSSPKALTQRTQTSSQELRSAEASTSLTKWGFTPQKHLDRQLEDLQDYFKTQEKNLRMRRLPPEQHNIIISQMQADYDAQKYALEQIKRQLATIQKMINTGAITPEAGNEAMWRLVLPERTHEALFQKP